MIMPFKFGFFISRLTIQQKLSLGYALALGVAALGTCLGFGISSHYYYQAVQAEQHAQEKVELLNQLQTTILKARTHQQQLIPLTQDLTSFQEEYTDFLKHKSDSQQTWSELKQFVAKSSIHRNYAHHKVLPQFIATYDGVLERYAQALNDLIGQIDEAGLESEASRKQAQVLLLAFTNSRLAIQYDDISDELIGIVEDSQMELYEAKLIFQKISSIAPRIVLASMVISGTIAAFLAVLISRAITQPIQVLTEVARQLTEESNFSLQVPVSTEDEIGSLAYSFNHLIQVVNQLLEEKALAAKQLETYNQSLENKVAERTQELQERTVRLQNLLEELQRTQTQLIQAEKMSGLGQLVAGVAHEINNPVNFIYGNLVHVEEYMQGLMQIVKLYQQIYPRPVHEIKAQVEDVDLEFLQEDLPKLLTSMKIGTDRIRQIVLSLRNFSRSDEAAFKAVDIHEGLESTLLILQHRWKATPNQPEIKVIRQYGNLPLVECYPSQLNQVFMNILANAIDALEDRTLSQAHPATQQQPSQITIGTTVLADQWVKITIADNGLGIPEAIQARIFEPFFTTKPVGKGTGMGMSISYQIITEQHGGQLTFFSHPGKGTEFVIQIPVQQRTV